MIGIRRVLVGSMALAVLTAIATPASGIEHDASGRSAARWTARQATVPTGGQAKDLQFFATDCPSPSTCVSVGIDDGPVGRSIVAGRETTVRVPLPADATGFGADFRLLSCASATFCVAAGEYSAPQTFAAFFASWDGSSWRSVRAPAPLPSDDPYGELQALSCGAAGRCTAVTFGTVYTLASGRWFASVPALPAGTDNPRLAEVSCPSAAYCAIAGTADAGTGLTPIVMIDQAGRQTSLRLPDPPGWPAGRLGPRLLGLDCAATGHCVIVAGDQAKPRYLVSLDGSRAVYHRVAVPPDGVADSYVYDQPKSVSCPTVSTCWVLDGYGLRGASEFDEAVPVAIRLVDGVVTVFGLPQPAPARPARAEIDDLDCPTATSCVAVGSRRTNDGDPAYREAVLETLRYGSWRASLAPVPSGAPTPRAYELTDVACGAPGRCTADGGYQWDLRDGDDDFYFAQRRAVVARLVSR